MEKIKRLSEADFDEIFALSEFAFQYKLTEEELSKKKEEAKNHVIWGCMEDNQLAAKLHLHTLECYIDGQPFEMGGIGAVATWPEYRRKGHVRDLLEHALKYMKQEGQTLSFLHPFAFPFYRKFGWELTFVNKKYTIPMDKLKRPWNGDGYVERSDADIPLLQKIYTEYAKHFNGMLVRDEKWWKQRVLKDNYQIAVAYNDKQQAEGYLLYMVKDDVFIIEELVFNSLNAWKVLMQFTANHDSMATKIKYTVPENDLMPLFIAEPRFLQEIEPYFMARILDVPAFLQAYPYRGESKETVAIEVEDTFMEENSGTYVIDTGRNTVKRSDSSIEKVYCTIQQLTVMLLGYKRPIDLYRAGLIEGDMKQVEALEKAIPNKQTFLADFF
ncbi:GNAT family N-acetyltransferase [Sediminibacillus massiliensis]|uniref:GNAT family N-acetyltransferase n=1 Tax=Sediminibacillus massiliensis TaxID=1926277 RepID=UPI000988413A|nr:GNAT family N-acetyltransferase [Sediminibacillus massiliensis]